MAWLEKHPTSGRYKICFRWSGGQYKKTVKTTNRDEAEAIARRVDETIGLAERGHISVPADVDLAALFDSDGKLVDKPKVGPAPKPPPIGLSEVRLAWSCQSNLLLRGSEIIGRPGEPGA